MGAMCVRSAAHVRRCDCVPPVRSPSFLLIHSLQNDSKKDITYGNVFVYGVLDREGVSAPSNVEVFQLGR